MQNNEIEISFKYEDIKYTENRYIFRSIILGIFINCNNVKEYPI